MCIRDRKKRDAKLRSASSSFGKSIGNIKSKVLSGPSSILGKVLNFASLLLFGVAINAIAGVNRKVDDESKMMKENSENTGNFITGMVAGIQNFIAGFGLMEKKVNNTFDDVDNSIKNAENELQQFKGDADKLDDFNLSNILTDSTQDEREDKLEEEKSIDPKFKISVIIMNDASNHDRQNVDKNYENLDSIKIINDIFHNKMVPLSIKGIEQGTEILSKKHY